MKLSLAILDDDKQFIWTTSRSVEQYNKKSPNCICLSSFTSPIDFCLNFKHDIALIDVDINGTNGFKIAEKILRQNKDTVVLMMSNYFMSDEKDESLICKMTFKVSELIDRYCMLRHKDVRNVRQIISGEKRFKDVIAV